MVIARSIEILGLGPAHQSELLDLCRRPLALPHPSTVSRSQVFFDAALILMMKDWLARDTMSLFVCADSSPQAGYDIFVSRILFIPSSKLAAAFKASHELMTIPITSEQLAAEGTDLADRFSSRVQLAQSLKEVLLYSVSIPILMASGKTSLEHKVHAMLHYLWMLQPEPRLANLETFLRSVRCFCCDMGVEIGMADFTSKSISDLLPSWMTGVAAPAPGPDLAGLQGDHGLEGEGSVRAFPFAMPIAGVLHVVHNLTAEIHTSVSGWSDFLLGLKSLVTLMHIIERSL